MKSVLDAFLCQNVWGGEGGGGGVQPLGGKLGGKLPHRSPLR